MCDFVLANTEGAMLIEFFCIVMLCGLLGGYQHFRATYCLHFKAASIIKAEDGDSIFP
jgi:hypothetical protein